MIELFERRDPEFLRATEKEKHEAIERLISQGTWRSGYYFLLLIAILIVTPGLLLNNAAVIIGGMILAPLLVPILSFSLSVVSGNVLGVVRSLKILGVSIVLTLMTSTLLTLVLARTHIVVAWIPDSIDTGVYIFIAFCSGTAAAFAWVKENLFSSIAGVAVAVSLLPPLCATGVGLALMHNDLVRNSFILFIANLFGISIGGILVFRILGFISQSKVEQRALEKSGR